MRDKKKFSKRFLERILKKVVSRQLLGMGIIVGINLHIPHHTTGELKLSILVSRRECFTGINTNNLILDSGGTWIIHNNFLCKSLDLAAECMTINELRSIS